MNREERLQAREAAARQTPRVGKKKESSADLSWWTGKRGGGSDSPAPATSQTSRKDAVRRQKADDARTDARAAYNNGDKMFRYMEVISTVVGDVVGMVGAIVKDDFGGTSGDALGLKGVDNQNRQIWSVVEVIEEEGWTMCHADHVFQQTHSKSRDKFLSSGQQQAVSGKLVGIYTFRRREDAETT